jgi:hypothetical protein
VPGLQNPPGLVYDVYMASMETDAVPHDVSPAPSPARLLLGGAVLVAFGAAGLLWWRFGEAVYTSGLMTAFLACF